MKKIISNSILSAGVFAFILSITACHDNNNASPSTGSLALHLHTFVGDNEAENYGDTLVLSNGRKISVTAAQLYLSNFKLIKTDGSIIDGPDTVVFLRQGTEEYELGDALAGNYKSIRFDVGLSDAINGSTPNASDPVLYQPSMWFGASVQPDGFVFINFQGIIDTTLNANGTNLIPFAYKIGTNTNLETVTMPDQNHTIVPDQLDVFHIEVNYAGLLDGIQLSNSDNLQLTTAVQNSSALASQIVANIANIFQYE